MRLLLMFQCLPSQLSISPPGSRKGTSLPRKLLPGCEAAASVGVPAPEEAAGAVGAAGGAAGAGASGTCAEIGTGNEPAESANVKQQARKRGSFMGENSDGEQAKSTLQSEAAQPRSAPLTTTFSSCPAP